MNIMARDLRPGVLIYAYAHTAKVVRSVEHIFTDGTDSVYPEGLIDLGFEDDTVDLVHPRHIFDQPDQEEAV